MTIIPITVMLMVLKQSPGLSFLVHKEMLPGGHIPRTGAIK